MKPMKDYSPAPWHFDYQGKMLSVCDTDRRFVCRFAEMPTAADLRLIVMAPQMYEVLIELSSAFRPKKANAKSTAIRGKIDFLLSWMEEDEYEDD